MAGVGMLMLGGIAACREKAEGQAPLRGCVWRAWKPGVEGSLFLAGTIHILRAEDYPLAPAYEAAYRQADQVVLELPPGTGRSEVLARRMRERAALPHGRHLKDVISEDEWRRVEAWAASQGMPVSAFSGFHPWYVSLVIVAVEYARLGAGPDHGVDHYYELRAYEDGKPASGLETMEFQLDLFAEMTPQQELDMLEQTLSEVERVKEDFAEMLRAWKSGDLDALDELLYREAEQYPELMDTFLKKRNQAWVPKLMKMTEGGKNVLVLVGAGHLGGKAGVLSLLRAQGCEIEHFTESGPVAMGSADVEE